MSANVCAHCGISIEKGRSHQRSFTKAVSEPIRTRGLLDPPGRRAIQRTYVIQSVELICNACNEQLETEAAALEHFHKVFISIIGVMCLLFTVCMIVPALRAHILGFVHPLE